MLDRGCTLTDDILLFSDLHAHNFRYGKKLVPHIDKHVPGMFNSRLMDCICAVREMTDYAQEHDIKTVLFGGDMFHTRSVISTDVFTAIYREIERMAYKVDHIVMIPGNHDYGDRSGHVHSLQPFASIQNVTVMDRVGVVETPVADIVCVPYTDDPTIAKKSLSMAGSLAGISSRPSILLAHLGMQGATVGSDYVLISKSDIEVDDVPYNDFTACFFGHYHLHQKLFRNGWFIGATTGQNWGDANTTRGFLHLRLACKDGMFFDQIETSSPRFINLVEGGDPMDTRENDFVRYHYQGDKPLDFSGVAGNVEPIQHIEEDETALELPKDSLDPSSLVELWVEHQDSNKKLTQMKELVDLGKQLLAEAEGMLL